MKMLPGNLLRESRGVSEIIGFLIITAALFGVATYVLVAESQHAGVKAQGLMDVIREAELRQGELLTYVHASGSVENVIGNWLPGWSYRVPITVSAGGSGMPENYQVKVVLNTAVLISAGKMRSDAGDLRLTRADGAAYLSYWIENGVNTQQTAIWMRDSDALAANASHTIYAYYGNPAASSASSAVGVWGYDAGFGSTEGWVISLPNDAYDQVENSRLYARVKMTQSDAPYWVYTDLGRAITDFTLDYTVFTDYEVRYAMLSVGMGSDPQRPYGDQGSAAVAGLEGSPRRVCARGSPPTYYTTVGYDYFNKMLYGTVTKVGNTIRNRVWLTPDRSGTPVVDVSETRTTPTSLRYLYALMRMYSTGDPDWWGGWIDTVLLRKYVSPEPTTNVGSETSAATPLKVYLYNYGTENVVLGRAFVEGTEVQVLGYSDAATGAVYDSIPPGTLVDVTFSCLPPSNQFYLTLLSANKGLYSWRVVL